MNLPDKAVEELRVLIEEKIGLKLNIDQTREYAGLFMKILYFILKK